MNKTQFAIPGSDEKRGTVSPCYGGDTESNVVTPNGKTHLTLNGDVTICGLGVRGLVNVYSVSRACKKCSSKRIKKGFHVLGSLEA